ncbi:serine/threonine-protein phosphatase with EF-hands 1 isoform X3 [Heterodontus francisci]|uniref:serine/threonine-protein phosphatase with EF-hands 1 isoform X3 n=1 Tax=Heterodontus francisci TaxID=7792 RepID=UPI00355C4920
MRWIDEAVAIMGCSSSAVMENQTRRSDKVTSHLDESRTPSPFAAIKAAILIQGWYRRYVARMEMRRRYTWSIFQSIEYSGEQDQLQLSHFFSFLIDHYAQLSGASSDLLSQLLNPSGNACDNSETDKVPEYKSIKVPDSYMGPRLSFPLTATDANTLLKAFKQQQQLHSRYVLQLLHETKKFLKEMPNITHLSTCYSKEITVCGDLHGKLDDLLLIFYKNGLPTPEKPYVFNGDFVDRGKNSVEVIIILFAFLLIYPNDLHLNRGNHEDHIMNLRYGFTKEVMQKYKIVDILWSDPRNQTGCAPNSFRGGGCYFGQDVTERMLKKYNLKLLIRSHECKQEGYELCHNGKVITIFSASNYYEECSNRGAYVKLGPDLVPRFVQYRVSKCTRKLTLQQRVSVVEASALKSLREKFYAHKSEVITAFKQYDQDHTGRISTSQWASAVESVLHLHLPWRTLRPRLVRLSAEGSVEYLSSFEDLQIEQPMKEVQPNLIETMYRHRADLEIIFGMIDKDHSGMISIEEFRQTWKLFSSHLHINMDDQCIDDLARSIDFNKDGSIDFNEFLEAFRLVQKDDQ